MTLEPKVDEIILRLDRIEKALKIVPDKDGKINDFNSSFSAYEEFAKEELKLEQNTIDNQKSAILAYLKHCKGIINKETVKTYLNSNESDSWESNQIKALRRYIRDFLRCGNWINEFEFAQTRAKVKEKVPTNEQLSGFAQLLSKQTLAIFLITLSSGLRIGEVLSLRFGDIANEIMMINASTIHKGQTKHSWISFRTQQAEDHLYEYLDDIEFDYNNDSKLFAVSIRTVQEEFKRTSETVGITITPRLLRTIFAERCREAGIDKDYIDAFCGRISQGVLAKNYTDYSPEALRKQYDKVESFLTL